MGAAAANYVGYGLYASYENLILITPLVALMH